MNSDKQIVRNNNFNEIQNILIDKVNDANHIILSFLLEECHVCKYKYLMDSHNKFNYCLTCSKKYCHNCSFKKGCVCLNCNLDYVSYCRECFI